MSLISIIAYQYYQTPMQPLCTREITKKNVATKKSFLISIYKDIPIN